MLDSEKLRLALGGGKQVAKSHTDGIYTSFGKIRAENTALVWQLDLHRLAIDYARIETREVISTVFTLEYIG